MPSCGEAQAGVVQLSRVIVDRPLACYLARGCTVLDGDASERRSLEPLAINLLIRRIPLIPLLLLLPYHSHQAAIQLRLSPRALTS